MNSNIVLTLSAINAVNLDTSLKNVKVRISNAEDAIDWVILRSSVG